MLLYLLHYNNYYNRMHKKESNIFSYMDYRVNSNLMTNPITCNFNPNDGVTTKQIINWDGDIPDYIVASETGNEITSRWFVIEAVRKRGQQYELTLQRDLITDYYGNILNAPIFVKKGMLPPDDNFILSAEEGNFNQIKKDQKYIFDATATPWIVGYIPKDSFNEDDVTKRTISLPISDLELDYDFTTTEFEAYTSGREIFYPTDQFRTEILLGDIVGDYGFYQSKFVQSYLDNKDTVITECIPSTLASTNLLTVGIRINGTDISDATRVEIVRKLAEKQFNDSTRLMFKEQLYLLRNSYGLYDDTKYNEMAELLSGAKDKRVYDTETGNLYVIRVTNYTDEGTNGKYLNELPENEIFDGVVNAYKNALSYNYSVDVNVAGRVYNTKYARTFHEFSKNNIKVFTGNGIRVSLELVRNGRPVTFTIPKAANRPHCIDQPYDIFCIPYYSILNEGLRQYYESSEQTDPLRLRIDKNIVLKLMQNLPALVGSDNVYDIQIVPYCPLLGTGYDRIISKEYDVFGITFFDMFIECGPKYSDTPITQDDNILGFISWVEQSTFTTYSIMAETYHKNLPTDNIGIKVCATTDFIRINAGNSSKFFDFSLAKNRGDIGYRIECALKPFTPNIKITPEWLKNGLYSKPYSTMEYDPAGLILAGEMSISQATDRWADYELNNKNYLNIFDRQIQNMEFNRNISLLGEGLSGFAGTVAGGFAGATLGSFGGTAGAVAGGILGAAGGALTGGGDFAVNYMQQSENIAYTKDIFNYQLGNIKALPQGLARTSVLAKYDSIIPTAEYWSTTDEEKAALSEKIKYNGMTIQRIDKLVNYIDQGGFFQGYLIRVEDIIDDTHVLNALSNEINLGFYLPERNTE